MTTINGTILIRRPVEDVFDFVADERNEPAYNPQIGSVEKVTPGPIGVGTAWRAVAASRRRDTPSRGKSRSTPGRTGSPPSPACAASTSAEV